MQLREKKKLLFELKIFHIKKNLLSIDKKLKQLVFYFEIQTKHEMSD